MSIEVALLITELILLSATIVIVLYSIREGRQRSSLIMEVGKATKTLTRLEYFLAVSDSMTEAKREIIGCVTGRRPTGEDNKRVNAILSSIERATRKGVHIKYLLPKFHDRLYMGYLYTKAGAEVRYGSCSMIHSMRYIVVDGAVVIIGIPESVGEEEATRKGHRLPSEALASILKEHFYPCWSKQETFAEYTREVLEQTGASLKQLALEMGIEVKELERFLAQPSLQGHEAHQATTDLNPEDRLGTGSFIQYSVLEGFWG